MAMRRKLGGMLLAGVILASFLFAVSRVDSGTRAEGKEQLEAAVRRTAVVCYASEGFYPPDVAYMCSHYGLQYDTEVYIVEYSLFAPNLMPDITVLERSP